jgi:hypothetical protein
MKQITFYLGETIEEIILKPKSGFTEEIVSEFSPTEIIEKIVLHVPIFEEIVSKLPSTEIIEEIVLQLKAGSMEIAVLPHLKFEEIVSEKKSTSFSFSSKNKQKRKKTKTSKQKIQKKKVLFNNSNKILKFNIFDVFVLCYHTNMLTAFVCNVHF